MLVSYAYGRLPTYPPTVRLSVRPSAYPSCFFSTSADCLSVCPLPFRPPTARLSVRPSACPLFFSRHPPSTRHHLERQHAQRHRSGEYFDSLGHPPNKTLERYMNVVCSSWTYNSRQLQSVLSAFVVIIACIFLYTEKYRLNYEQYRRFKAL